MSDLKAAFEKEKADPAMIAYLKSLGIDPDYVAPADDIRRVVVKQLEIEIDGRESIFLKFETEEEIKASKKTPVVIKEGCRFKINVYFRVQHSVVPGLTIDSSISKMGVSFDDKIMLGSYPPSNEFKKIEINKGEWQTAPSGMLYRGDLKSKMKFLDDDKNKHLDIEYTITIAKDW